MNTLCTYFSGKLLCINYFLTFVNTEGDEISINVKCRGENKKGKISFIKTNIIIIFLSFWYYNWIFFIIISLICLVLDKCLNLLKSSHFFSCIIDDYNNFTLHLLKMVSKNFKGCSSRFVVKNILKLIN